MATAIHVMQKLKDCESYCIRYRAKFELGHGTRLRMAGGHFSHGVLLRSPPTEDKNRNTSEDHQKDRSCLRPLVPKQEGVSGEGGDMRIVRNCGAALYVTTTPLT